MSKYSFHYRLVVKAIQVLRSKIMVINNNDNADKTKVDKVIHDVEQDRILAFQSLFGEKYKIFLKYEKLFVEVTHTYNGIIIVTDIFDYI